MEIENLKEQFLTACKIIVKSGLDSGPFGNISIRIPGRDAYLQNPSGITFDRLKLEDILVMNNDGVVLDGRHVAHPGECIHREIYRLRPDVNAIVHTHSKRTVAMSLLKTKIEPFTQVGAAFYQDQGLYLGFTGPVRDSSEGRGIAEALGKNSMVIAKNHGIFTVGDSIQSALWNFIVADLASEVHLDARAAGIHAAESLDDNVYKKSRVEVRDRQYQAMWDNYAQIFNTEPEAVF